MSTIYNWLRDGGMILRIKPKVTNCDTLKVFSTFDVGLKHLLTIANGTGTGRYTGNEMINIIANAVSNYYFDHWTDPSSVVTNINNGTTTVTMPFLDCTVTATFLPYRTLIVNNGSGSSNILKPTNVVSIVANAPATNYIFDNWSGDTAYLSANTSTANVTMPDANIVLTANYKVNFSTIKYGLLYNWYAASNANFAPAGWHVATGAEWITLFTYLDLTVAGGKLKETGLTYWNTPNLGATNEVGFNARGSGIRNGSDGIFSSLKNYMIMNAATYPYQVSLAYNSATYSYGFGNSKNGTCVRLVKDDSSNPGFLIDIDGNVYSTVTIGSQVWLVTNWKCTKLNDGTTIPEVTDNTTWTGLITGALCAYNNDWNNV